MYKRVAIIGGGASGCFAALCLKLNNKDIEVTIYEKNDRILKKLLSTGNGRCNLSNSSAYIHTYYNQPQFVENVFSVFGSGEALHFFENELGVHVSSIGELVYPSSFAASTVVSAILYRLERLGINICCNRKIEDICSLPHDYIIASVGTRAGQREESTLSVFKSIDIMLTEERPSLVPLICNKQDIKGLAGLRARVAVTLGSHKEYGEILFKENSLSGIVIFSLSRFYDNQKEITLDFMPELGLEEVRKLLKKRERLFEVEELLGLLPKNIGQAIIQKGEDIAKNIKAFKVQIVGVDSFFSGQVVRGGVNISEIDGALRLRKNNRVFVVGEAVDIDGACGGFNLQWAWSSAYVAANCIIKEIANAETKENKCIK